MSPNNTQQPATDFSNYAWFNGAFRGDAANVATGKDGRLYLGIKGRDLRPYAAAPIPRGQRGATTRRLLALARGA